MPNTNICVVRPFPGGRHSHAARRAGRDRGASGARASGAGDAVNGKYEKKTVSSQSVWLKRLTTVFITKV